MYPTYGKHLMYHKYTELINKKVSANMNRKKKILAGIAVAFSSPLKDAVPYQHYFLKQ